MDLGRAKKTMHLSMEFRGKTRFLLREICEEEPSCSLRNGLEGMEKKSALGGALQKINHLTIQRWKIS